MSDQARLGKGYVHVYGGDGKGKTTAALGLCLRAAGHGMRSLVIQLIKGDRSYGELAAARKLGDLITVVSKGRGTIIKPGSLEAEDIRLAREALELAHTQMATGDYAIVVLDEVNIALDLGLLPLESLLEIIDAKPDGVELILTGRKAHPEVVQRADLVTECLMIKHYAQQDVPPRTGIEV